ncbi:MAG: transcriptional repressor LexA [Bdellovibrionales bacterium]|nr:transcriptional repressor LexA [Bdellovibrionales bacterium]
MEVSNPIQPLTPKEKLVLEFIESYIEDQGYSPSYAEIQDHFGFASINSVQNYLKQLESKDYLFTPGGNQKRAIRVLRSSKAMPDNLREIRTRLTPNITVPLLGMVAAGAPIEHLKHDEYIDIPVSLLKNPDMTYALQVQGDSMIEDGIHDGDTILVQRQQFANDGEIIVAVVNHEATVKRYYSPKKQTGHRVELRPANSSMESFWYDPREVDIRGIVVGLIRKYS